MPRALLSGSLQLRDDRRRDGRDGIRYRPAWSFTGETEAFLAWVLKRCPGPVVHVCCGASRLGDVRADLTHPGADVRCDARALPFRGVGTILMDPPWGLPLPERARFVHGAAKALRPGGVLLLYAPWMPRLPWADLEGCWVREDGRYDFPGAAVMLTKFRMRSAGNRGSE